MISISEVQQLDPHRILLLLSDGNQNCQCELRYDDSDIPVVKWDPCFDRQFIGRFSDAQPLLEAAMDCFRLGIEIKTAPLPGNLRSPPPCG